MNFDNDNNESELLNKVYVSQEGCFLYLRDERMSQTPNFLTFIENGIKQSMKKNVDFKLWLIKNDALHENTKFELKVAITEITPENILSVISENEFGWGFLCLVLSPTMEKEIASKLWLKLVECKLQNLSPESTEFGSWETFSITGDSNILLWTNCGFSMKEIRKIALDSDFQALDDEISMQVFSSR